MTLLALITSTQTTLTMQNFSQAELEAEAEYVKTDAHKINMQKKLGEIITIYKSEKERLLRAADATNETSLSTNFLESQRLFKIEIKLLEKYAPRTDRKDQQIEYCKHEYKLLNDMAKFRGII